MDEILERFNREREVAYATMTDLEKRFEVRRKELERELQVKLEAEFGNTVSDARKTYYRLNASIEAREGEICVTKATQKLPYPEGTVLCEWNHPSYNWDAPATLTNVKGVFQVFRKGDDCVSGRHDTPRPGAFVVRILKIDGTPGKKVVVVNNENRLNYWLPEGVQHPKAAKS